MPASDEYEVVIAQYGTRQGHRAEVYLNYGIYGQPDGPIGMDYFVWIIRNAERTILVDVGFSVAGGENRKRTFLKAPEDIYAALGIDIEAEQTIIVTHAHYDHIGNLDKFPNSQILIAQAEYDFWDSEMGRRAQFAWSTEDEEIDALRAAHRAGRVTTFSGSMQVAPGIELIEFGGHTPGISVVKVATPDGIVLLASDTIHYYEEYDADLPFAFVADLPQMYAGFDRIRALVDAGEIQHLVPGHDPDTLNRFDRIQDGPLAGIASTIGSRTS